MLALPRRIRALVFDVFGTVVDWRGSIIRECRALGRRKKLERTGSPSPTPGAPATGPRWTRVRRGELPWMNIDALHRLILDDLLSVSASRGSTEDEIDHLNRVWHRLNPWPDAVAGWRCSSDRHVIATLSNGNVALLTNMAKHAGLALGLHLLGRAVPPLQARSGDLPRRRRDAGPASPPR